MLSADAAIGLTNHVLSRGPRPRSLAWLSLRGAFAGTLEDIVEGRHTAAHCPRTDAPPRHAGEPAGHVHAVGSPSIFCGHKVPERLPDLLVLRARQRAQSLCPIFGNTLVERCIIPNRSHQVF